MEPNTQLEENLIEVLKFGNVEILIWDDNLMKRQEDKSLCLNSRSLMLSIQAFDKKTLKLNHPLKLLHLQSNSF